jgi:hypothetical protein
LLHSDFVAEPEQQAVKSFLHNNKDLPGTYGDVEYQDWNRHPATDAWKRSREALRQDADAPLP